MKLRFERRLAFTLMELMIALGLLGALMAVAWSLLGTFRDAEMRGWKLSFRTQTIRSARTWLEDDMQHLAVADSPDQASFGARSRAPSRRPPQLFRGNAMGFSATIAPSIDPIPFLGNMMSESQPEAFQSENSLSDRAGTGQEIVNDGTGVVDEMGGSTAYASPWPADTVEIEYQLAPMSSGPSVSSRLSEPLLDKTQYSLTRREKTGARIKPNIANPAERVLGAQDLYRQADDSALFNSPPIRESKLDGLMKPQFRYYDGVSWGSQWNSFQRGGLPRAVAFGFDFPSSADIEHPSERSIAPSSGEDLLAGELQAIGAQSSTGELALDAMAERPSGDNRGLMESSTNEVQFVIYIGAGVEVARVDSNQPIPQELLP